MNDTATQVATDLERRAAGKSALGTANGTGNETVKPLDLRPGEWAVVRSEAEILATLDENAMLAGQVFMPEMLAYCGQRVRVYKRADKTCDTITLRGMMRLEHTVHLDAARCNGAAHGNCEAACLFFWKEAWLRRPEGAAAARAPLPGRDRAWLEQTVTKQVPDNNEIHYRCQATEIKHAACPLKWWEPTQYVRDVRTNEVSPWTVARSLTLYAFNRVLKKLTGRQYPSVAGKLQRTPSEALDLQVGEWVVVKDRDEIVATLDQAGKNRGMSFESEMLPYVGKKYRVIARVHQIIEESTGRMKKLGSAGIILEDVICASAYRTPCPRANYLYWREIWLRRAEPHEIGEPADKNPLKVLNDRSG